MGPGGPQGDNRTVGDGDENLAPAIALLLTACASAPTGPSVMVLPGSGKSFEQFQAEDAACRQWAAQQAETTQTATPAQHRYDISYMPVSYTHLTLPTSDLV